MSGSRDWPHPREAVLACADARVMGLLREAMRRVHPQTMLYLASTGDQVRLMVSTLPVALIIADLDLAAPSLAEFLAHCRWRSPRARVVALAPHRDDERLLAALRGAAAGFLFADDPVAGLAASLRAIARGSAMLTASLARQIIREMDGHGTPVPAPQWRLLALIAAGCTPEQAAAQLAVAVEQVQEDIDVICRRIAQRGAGPADSSAANGDGAA